MANLSQKNGIYLARFRFRGKEYKKSLKTTDRRSAEAALAQVELTIHRLTVGLIAVPIGVDPGAFVLSGGTLMAPQAAPTPPSVVPSVADAVAAYQDNVRHLADTTRMTVSVHLRNLLKKLGPVAAYSVDRVTPRHVDDYIQRRLTERSGDTVKKERSTLLAFFGWCVRQGYLTADPTAGMTTVKAGGNAARFLTLAEIEAAVARGGLTPAEEWALWDRLFLRPAEIGELLAIVYTRARHDVSHILYAVAAYTGMRRGEVLRLRWDDVEFDAGVLVARSRKQSRQEAETTRRIDLHPELKEVLLAWRVKRPRGQFVACDDGSLDPLGRHQAEERFWQPLKGTKWVIPERHNRPRIGFHTLRHSFASNLAAAGVDQRVIDEFMGHTTEAMRKRYRHLFPANTRSAIESFSLAVG